MRSIRTCQTARAAVVSACVVLMVACLAHAELTARSYVLDGLIAHWDGIENVAYGDEHAPSSSTWTELKGSGVDFALPASSSWESKGLRTIRYYGANSAIAGTAVIDAFNTQFCTIEIAFNKTTETPVSSLGHATALAGLFGFNYEGKYWAGTEDDTYAGVNAMGSGGRGPGLVGANRAAVTTTVGAHILSCVQDGTNLVVRFDDVEKKSETGEAQETAKISNARMLCINRVYYDDSGIDGIYHAIRCYNRPLTSDEQAVNKAVDQVRFGFKTVGETSLPDGWRFLTDGGDVTLQRRHVVGVEGSVGGKVSVDGGEAQTNVDIWVENNVSSSATLTAVPDPGFAFYRWRGLSDTTQARSATVTQSVTNDVVAVFYRIDAEAKKITARSYVREGLIAHWDGECNVAYGAAHSSTASAWANLTGLTGDFTLEDGWSFEGGKGLKTTRASYAKITDEDSIAVIDAFSNAVFSAEIAYTMPEAETDAENVHKKTVVKMLGMGSDRYFVGMNYDDGRIGFSGRGKQSGPRPAMCVQCNAPSDLLGFHTYSVQQNVANWLVDMDGTSKSGSDAAPEGDTYGVRKFVGLGSAYNTYTHMGLNGTYHAIRFYGRALTADEIAVNRALDQVRFAGKDPEACVLPQGWRFNYSEGLCLERRFTVSSNNPGMGQIQVSDEPAKDSDSCWVDTDTQNVYLKAIPGKRYKFVRWQGGIEGADLRASEGVFTVTGDVCAVFAIETGFVLMVK